MVVVRDAWQNWQRWADSSNTEETAEHVGHVGMGVVTVGGVGLEAMLGENMAATGTGELGRSRVDVQFSMLDLKGVKGGQSSSKSRRLEILEIESANK